MNGELQMNKSIHEGWETKEAKGEYSSHYGRDVL
jgi:hypothetical protein